jgi:transcriptional regulator with XRE-family HTH domain
MLPTVKHASNAVNDACKAIAYSMQMESKQTMAERISMLREARGYSQEQLGDLCGVTRAAVYQWETGATANIKLEPFLRLVEVLGTSPHYLVFGEHRPDPRPDPGSSARLKILKF